MLRSAEGEGGAPELGVLRAEGKMTRGVVWDGE